MSDTEPKMTESLLRTAINDQDLTRALDLGTQILVYRKQLIAAGVSVQVADHMCVRFNEYVLAERFRSGLK